MIYLFVGIDEISKERKLQQLKQEVLKNNQDVFDYERLHAEDLTPASLNESLKRIPLSAKRRLIFIRDIEKFSTECKEIILARVKNPKDDIILILDTQSSQLKDPFLLKIASIAKVSNFGRNEVVNTFSLARAIQSKRISEALKIFSVLYQKGEHPTRILGGLAWSWRKMRASLKAEDFKKGIGLFLETDTNIKFSKLKPETAMEMLIVKLCFLTGG